MKRGVLCRRPTDFATTVLFAPGEFEPGVRETFVHVFVHGLLSHCAAIRSQLDEQTRWKSVDRKVRSIN